MHGRENPQTANKKKHLLYLSSEELFVCFAGIRKRTSVVYSSIRFMHCIHINKYRHFKSFGLRLMATLFGPCLRDIIPTIIVRYLSEEIQYLWLPLCIRNRIDRPTISRGTINRAAGRDSLSVLR